MQAKIPQSLALPSEGSLIEGLQPGKQHTVVQSELLPGGQLRLVVREAQGAVNEYLLSAEQAAGLRVVGGADWSSLAAGASYKLAAEALRIRLAHLFDPLVALHCSLLDPLPHQISAVYETMLERHPLRFLLADDPGAGKTIMAGLLIKELLVRGDLKRCIVVCPGSLAEQWRDELLERFQLRFRILTSEELNAASVNWFDEQDLIIARLDKLSRNEDLQRQLSEVHWDLAIFDEAHKLSASRFGTEVKYTKRYRLGQLVSRTARHLLLMSATPHNGKPDDFHLFLALIDQDRFEGQLRSDDGEVDVRDIMRRMVKEQLLRFDGRPLFPERRAETAEYELSPLEARLYDEVTDYVKEEFNRADKLGDDARKGTVGFALTSLQRRLASSPESILQSLRRRQQRLADRLKLELEQRGERGESIQALALERDFDAEDIDDLDEGSKSDSEVVEERLTENASAATTVSELQAEIAILGHLVSRAEEVRRSAEDCKWKQLSSLLQLDEMTAPDGRRHKLVIFTEFLDTLKYLTGRLRTLLGRESAVVEIHGSMNRDERRRAQGAFAQDPQVEILVATDAAGEGINLQCAHLMINYDLPWNPNRLEQRFGRIHRIGQREVCHLWNLLAANTREGEVFERLLRKLEVERKALSGSVFDILGRVFQQERLRDLLIQAIRYGERQDVRDRLNQKLDEVLNHQRLKDLMEDRALTTDSLAPSRVQEIRELMERAAARRLQPYYIQAFSLEALSALGGTVHEREPGRFEVTYVPAALRSAPRTPGCYGPVLERYSRITFERERIAPDGLQPAEFVAANHPLLDALLTRTQESNGTALQQGSLLIDPLDEEERLRVLVCVQQELTDGTSDPEGRSRVISKRLHFMWLDEQGNFTPAGPAPYLDFESSTAEQQTLLAPLLSKAWLLQSRPQAVANWAAANLMPAHLEEVRLRREELVKKIEQEVRRRLNAEISYWQGRAEDLRNQMKAGKQTRMNWEHAIARRDELIQRQQQRLAELARERSVTARMPVLLSRTLVASAGLLRRLGAELSEEQDLAGQEDWPVDAAARRRIELLAMAAVMAKERELGHHPRDVSKENRGYDIESVDGQTGHLRFIEVKGRAAGMKTVSLTRNELLCAYNCPEDWYLAVVVVKEQPLGVPLYIQKLTTQPLANAMTSMTFSIEDLSS